MSWWHGIPAATCGDLWAVAIQRHVPMREWPAALERVPADKRAEAEAYLRTMAARLRVVRRLKGMAAEAALSDFDSTLQRTLRTAPKPRSPAQSERLSRERARSGFLVEREATDAALELLRGSRVPRDVAVPFYLAHTIDGFRVTRYPGRCRGAEPIYCGHFNAAVDAADFHENLEHAAREWLDGQVTGRRTVRR